MFNIFKRRNSKTIYNESSEYMLAAEKLTDILCTTNDVIRFFSLYQRILDLINLIDNMNPEPEIRERSRQLKNDLLSPLLINTFFDRCLNDGMLAKYKDDIISYRNIIPAKSYEYFVRLSGLSYEQYIYCSVSFGDERTYSYICEFEEIFPGDLVVVPVGENNEEKLATVIDVGIYRYDEVPYPLNKTKTIILKIGN